MISSKLIQEIKDIQKRSSIAVTIIATFLASIMIYFSYQENGFENWMYLMASFPFIVALLVFKESKVLNILEKSPEQIKHIALKKEDSQLEIDIFIKDKAYNYSLKLPYSKGLEIAEKLMLELPNIDFYDDYHNKITNIHEAKL